MKDFKYIIKRVIIGILIGLFFILFKSCNVHATTIENVNATTYFTTQYCDLDNNNVFQCSNGPSFRFPYQVNNSGNDYSFYPFLLNTDDYYVLFKNMIIKYDFTEPITIDTTHRSIYTMFRGNYISTSINDGFQINQNWFRSDIIVNESTDNRYKTPINYSFKPYYCEYIDSNDITHTCGVILEHGTNADNFWFVYDIPLNSVVKSIKVYIGDYNYYTSYNRKPLVSGTSLYVPNNSNITYFEWVSGRTNFQTYRVNYNTYRSQSNTHSNGTSPSTSDNIGLYWLFKGYTLNAPTFNVPTTTTELNYTSSTYTNNTYKYYFDSYSQDLMESISGTTNRVDEELDGGSEEEDGYRDTWLEDLYGDFNQGFARNFSDLFSNLFAYPIAKLNEQKDIDLVRTNLQNNVILNNLLCTRNSGLDNMTGDYNPYEIHLWGSYTFKLPCPHTDIYPLLKSGTYAFYPNVFKGAHLQQGVVFSFTDIWLTLQHGLLVYFLFVNILNMFKYMVDYHKHEVEVLEL